ncbi:MAG: DUF4192 domain-containing protein [Nocardioides sp.]|jgi:hypothetical protein
MINSLTVRTPEDVLALIPMTLGFAPQESLILLSLRGPDSFHARITLPDLSVPNSGPPTEFVQALVGPVLQHGLIEVILVAITSRPGAGESCVLAVGRALESHGVLVRDSLLADGQHWWPLSVDHGRGSARRYDLSDHPFHAAAVLRGKVIHASREEMEQTLSPDPQRMEVVDAKLASRVDSIQNTAQVALEHWSLALVAECTARRRVPTPEEVARLLLALRDLRIRDAALVRLTRADARDQVDFWRHVATSAPPEVRAAPAALTGFAAWLNGDGALAWAAVKVAEQAESGYSLAVLLTDALEHAINPSVWDDLRTQGLPAQPA